MDIRANLERLVWLATTDIQSRKAYAWAEATGLDGQYPGISAALLQVVKHGQDVNTAYDNLVNAKPHSALVK